MRESEVAQSCPTLSDPMDCSLPGSFVHGLFQARVLEWECHCLLRSSAINISYRLVMRTESQGCLFSSPNPFPYCQESLKPSGSPIQTGWHHCHDFQNLCEIQMRLFSLATRSHWEFIFFSPALKISCLLSHWNNIYCGPHKPPLPISSSNIFCLLLINCSSLCTAEERWRQNWGELFPKYCFSNNSNPCSWELYFA